MARRDRAILETLYGTGIRISELVGLSLRDVDLHDGFMRVVGKGDKERIVPVLGAANDALADVAQRSTDAERWCRSGGGAGTTRRPCSSTSAAADSAARAPGSCVRAHGDAAGLGEVLTPHVLRHSCATHLLDHGADIRAVQELFGHASIGTTQVYTRVSDERLVAAWRSGAPRGGR